MVLKIIYLHEHMFEKTVLQYKIFRNVSFCWQSDMQLETKVCLFHIWRLMLILGMVSYLIKTN